MSLKIKIYYPFHPLCGMELNLACPTRKKDGLVTVFEPSGFPLKVPLWMTSPSAADFQLSDVATLYVKGLLALCEIMQELHSKKQNERSTTIKKKRKLAIVNSADFR